MSCHGCSEETWRSRLSAASLRRLDTVQSKWLDTPYMVGQRKCRGGVDCRNLIAGILDELYGVYTPLPVVPNDVGIHGQKPFFHVLRIFRRAYPSEVVQNGTIHAGDVILTKAEFSSGGGPNHVVMATARANTVIHARPGGVVVSSIVSLPPVVRVFRLLDSERWLKS